MGGISVDGGGRGGRRSLDSEINMIPMIDLLMVTISFLLITAVWSNMSRIEASTNAPSQNPDPTPPAAVLALHVVATDPARVTLEWREGEHVVSTTQTSRSELGKSISEEWRAHGVHKATSDAKADRAVIHTANDAKYSEFVAILDAVSQEQRSVVFGGKSHKMQVFEPVLATN